MTTDQTPDTGDGAQPCYCPDSYLDNGIAIDYCLRHGQAATLRHSLTLAEAEIGRLRVERAKDQAEMLEATKVINEAAALIPGLTADRDTLTARLAEAEAELAHYRNLSISDSGPQPAVPFEATVTIGELPPTRAETTEEVKEK